MNNYKCLIRDIKDYEDNVLSRSDFKKYIREHLGDEFYIFGKIELIFIIFLQAIVSFIIYSL